MTRTDLPTYSLSVHVSLSSCEIRVPYHTRPYTTPVFFKPQGLEFRSLLRPLPLPRLVQRLRYPSLRPLSAKDSWGTLGLCGRVVLVSTDLTHF